MKKVLETFDEVVADVADGSAIMLGYFAGPGGTPCHLIEALARQGAKDLTIICNGAGGVGLTLDYADHRVWFENRQVRKIISSFPFSPSPARQTPAEKQILAGEVELEIVPQGTLAERIRAAGAGIAAFYTPTGAGTVIEEGKEKRDFEGRPHLLEHALKADYALIRAYRADEMGNLIYRGTMRQFNPIMAMAARVTIAEVDEIGPTGSLDPEAIVTPGIFVNRVVQVNDEPGWPRQLERRFWSR